MPVRGGGGRARGAEPGLRHPASTWTSPRDGHLKLVPRPASGARHMPIDSFLQTLAEAQGSQAIGVILSGTGSDGTLGCKAIKAEGGIAFAQDPASAKYDGMPQQRHRRRLRGLRPAPEGSRASWSRLGRHPVRVARPPRGRAAARRRRTKASLASGSSPLLATGHRRRLQRLQEDDPQAAHRAAHGREPHRDAGDYAQPPRGRAPARYEALYQDCLITVTSFFRDPEVFEALSDGLPALLRAAPRDAPLRVWVPGCATGEEAYSIAICLLERLERACRATRRSRSSPPTSARRAIEKARAGIYLENIAADVSPERLRRFFAKVDGRYQVSKAVRDLCVFARHDLTRDPPFSRLDLISCRNVLIYLEPRLQERVLATFHYALRARGLPGARAVGDGGRVLATSSRSWTRSTGSTPGGPSRRPPPTRARPAPAAAVAPRRRQPRAPLRARGRGRSCRARGGPDPARPLRPRQRRRRRERTTSSSSAATPSPSSSTTHGRGQPEPRSRWRARDCCSSCAQAIQEARGDGAAAPQGRACRCSDRGQSRAVELEVVRSRARRRGERCLLVLFEEAPARRAAPAAAAPRGAARPRAGGEIAQLEAGARETTRATSQAVMEEHEAAHEELQAANEEARPATRSCRASTRSWRRPRRSSSRPTRSWPRSTRSCRTATSSCSGLNDDLDNLLASTNIPIVMLGRDLRVRRFTAAAGDGAQPRTRRTWAGRSANAAHGASDLERDRRRSRRR